MKQIKKLFCLCTLFVLNCNIQGMITEFKVGKPQKESSTSSVNNKAEILQQTVDEFFNLLETYGEPIFNNCDKSIWTKKISAANLSKDPLLSGYIAKLLSSYKVFLIKLKNSEFKTQLKDALKSLLEPWKINELQGFLNSLKELQVCLKIMLQKTDISAEEKQKSFDHAASNIIYPILVKVFNKAQLSF